VNTTGLPTRTPVAASGGSTARTDTGVSSSTIEPTFAVLPLAARFWLVRRATPVVTGSLTSTENAPRGTPRAVKWPSLWACSVTAPRKGSSRTVTREPAAGVTPSDLSTMPVTVPLSWTLTSTSSCSLGAMSPLAVPYRLNSPDCAVSEAV
jgi:hypothetical protein